MPWAPAFGAKTWHVQAHGSTANVKGPGYQEEGSSPKDGPERPGLGPLVSREALLHDQRRSLGETQASFHRSPGQWPGASLGPGEPRARLPDEGP